MVRTAQHLRWSRRVFFLVSLVFVNALVVVRVFASSATFARALVGATFVTVGYCAAALSVTAASAPLADEFAQSLAIAAANVLCLWSLALSHTLAFTTALESTTSQTFTSALESTSALSSTTLLTTMRGVRAALSALGCVGAAADARAVRWGASLAVASFVATSFVGGGMALDDRLAPLRVNAAYALLAWLMTRVEYADVDYWYAGAASEADALMALARARVPVVVRVVVRLAWMFDAPLLVLFIGAPLVAYWAERTHNEMVAAVDANDDIECAQSSNADHSRASSLTQPIISAPAAPMTDARAYAPLASASLSTTPSARVHPHVHTSPTSMSSHIHVPPSLMDAPVRASPASSISDSTNAITPSSPLSTSTQSEQTHANAPPTVVRTPANARAPTVSSFSLSSSSDQSTDVQRSIAQQQPTTRRAIAPSPHITQAAVARIAALANHRLLWPKVATAGVARTDEKRD